MKETVNLHPAFYSRLLDDRIERYTKIIKGHCSCGEAVHKVLGSSCTCWKNGDRYHYPEATSAWCIFRCRACGNPIHNTFTNELALLPHDNKSTIPFLQSLERVEGKLTEVSFNTSFKENEI